MMKIESGKFYKTRDGRRVRVVSMDGNPENEVIGLLDENDGPLSWALSGAYFSNRTHAYDLISEWPAETPKRKRRVIYVNEYSNEDEKRTRTVVHRTKKQAENWSLENWILHDHIRLSRWVEDLKFRDEWDKEGKK